MAITTRNNANYGPLTTIALSVDGSTFTTMGLLGGQFHLNPGQSLQVTYVVAPTMTYTAI